MKATKFNALLYFIVATIVITIGVQFYWNLNNYQLNRQRVANEIQLSLDTALDEYYAEIAKSDFLTIIETQPSTTEPNTIWLRSDSDSIKTYNFPKSPAKTHTYAYEINEKMSKAMDTILIDVQNEFQDRFPKDSLLKNDSIKGYTQWGENGAGYNIDLINGITNVQVFKGKEAADSISMLKKLKSIFISIQRDSLEYQRIDTLIQLQLAQKKIALNYQLVHLKNGKEIYAGPILNPSENHGTVRAKSTYLKAQEFIDLHYSSPFFITLKRSFFGISISLLLALAIISCLFYLLKVIKQQKQVAEIKNDLISNITHEFKTPIATIGVAVESIRDFNVIEDKVKTHSYLDISSNQLAKLNTMVEKLLETATLDSEALELQVEKVNLYAMLKDLVEKHQLQDQPKQIKFSSSPIEHSCLLDAFHIENAINNILDNAIKYGGDQITVNLSQTEKMTTLKIKDNGTSLSQANLSQLFEKFYRVPSGNKHDIKGFGIGLYYTKKIIEKHGGKIFVNLDNNHTNFIIHLPHHG